MDFTPTPEQQRELEALRADVADVDVARSVVAQKLAKRNARMVAAKSLKVPVNVIAEVVGVNREQVRRITGED